MTLTGFAVDLGGTKTAAARIENGKITARVQRPTDAGADLSRQLDLVAALLHEIGFAYGDPLGVAVAGRVDRDGNWHAVNIGTLTAISAAPLGAMLVTRFGARTCALNDAAAAAVAESRIGAGQGVQNFAFITVSTGVGGGLILGGRLLQSANGLAGHIGFSSTPFGDALCGSGRRGTVESVAGGRAIAAAAQLPNARAVFESGAHQVVIDTAAQAIARLIGDLTAILGLERVAVGGSIGLAEGFLPKVAAALEHDPALFRPALVPAALGPDSGLIGAVLAAQHGL